MTTLVLRLERMQEALAASAARHVVDLAAVRAAGAATTPPLARWSGCVADAHDPCLVLDVDARVVAVSPAGAELLGCAVTGTVGRPLLEVIDVVDFDTGGSAPDYAGRIAPLAVLTAGSGLMRSLLRVRHSDGRRLTLDAAAAPIKDAAGTTVGSLSFLATLRT